MTSVMRSVKQVPMNSGYYITLASAAATIYDLTGSTANPIFAATSVLTGVTTAGQVLRDEGVVLRSAGRIFRKVQLMSATGSVQNGGTDGVGGVAAPNTTNTGYLTAYIELPGNPSSGNSTYTPVARLG